MSRLARRENEAKDAGQRTGHAVRVSPERRPSCGSSAGVRLPDPPTTSVVTSHAYRHLIVAAALLPALAACGDSGAPPAGTAIVRDSAGVTIVESFAPAWDEDDAWQLSAKPLLEIGATDGPPEYLFNRIVGAVRLEDGSIVVANAGSQQIRFYNASGTHQRSIGRSGSGPGEFQSIGWLDRFRGDSLVAHDPQSARATVITRAGEFARAIPLARHSSGGMPSLLDVAEDGTFIGSVSTVREPDDLASGMLSAPVTYYRLSPDDGSLHDSLVTLPGQASHLQVTESSITVMRPLIGPAPHAAATGDAIFIGFGGSFEIREFTPDGALQRLIRRAGDPRPLTESELAALREERLAGVAPEMIQGVTHVLASMPTPAFRPAFASLLADAAGYLWVEESNLPGEPNGWAVFDAEGRLLGSMELPDGFTPFEVGDDYILGVATDDFGVERLQVYGLGKS